MKKQKIDELEKQHAAGYPRKPSEFENLESEQVWPEDDQFEHDEAIQQTGTTRGRTRVMRH